jgi:hypothetical protein
MLFIYLNIHAVQRMQVEEVVYLLRRKTRRIVRKAMKPEVIISVLQIN